MNKGGRDIRDQGKRKTAGLRITERDLRVLSALEKWGVLGLGQLDGALFRRGDSRERMRLFFNETTRSDYWRTGYKRLRLLEKEGLIRVEIQIGESRYYLLTKKGHRLLKWFGEACLRWHRKEVPALFLRHELLVNAVGLALAELRGIKTWTAREWLAREGFVLRRFRDPERRIIPDLRVLGFGRPVAVEVELTQKSWRRYRQIWHAYASRWRRRGLVLYLVDWPSGMERLIGLARKWGHEFVYVSSLSEFKKHGGRCPFIRRESSGLYADLFLDSSKRVS